MNRKGKEQRQRFIQRIGDEWLRVVLTPLTRWGQLYFHVFNKGDPDPDPHDHPWDFWTFPFKSYVEEVMNEHGVVTLNIVKAFRWTFRPATHTNRVRRPLWGKRIITLVWHSPYKQGWGFWSSFTNNSCFAADDIRFMDNARFRGTRVWVPWRRYLGLDPKPELSPELWEFRRDNATLDVLARHPELKGAFILDDKFLNTSDAAIWRMILARSEYIKRGQA